MKVFFHNFSQLDKIFHFAVFNGVPKYWEEVAYYNDITFRERLKNMLIEKDWIWDEGELT